MICIARRNGTACQKKVERNTHNTPPRTGGEEAISGTPTTTSRRTFVFLLLSSKGTRSSARHTYSTAVHSGQTAHRGAKSPCLFLHEALWRLSFYFLSQFHSTSPSDVLTAAVANLHCISTIQICQIVACLGTTSDLKTTYILFSLSMPNYREKRYRIEKHSLQCIRISRVCSCVIIKTNRITPLLLLLLGTTCSWDKRAAGMVLGEPDCAEHGTKAWY